MRKDHDINNMGDFLNCKNPKCIWGATWSMGHICNCCRLSPCICPCPLTKEWLEKNKYEIGLKRIHEILQHDKSSIETVRRMANSGEHDYFKESNKQKWNTDGKLELIERLYGYIPQLKNLMKKEKEIPQNES